MSYENNAVQSLLEQREATAYLRKRDCEMLSTLKGHLAEHNRLNDVLNQINQKISQLQQTMRTPKPRIGLGALVWGIILLVLGVAGFVAYFVLNGLLLDFIMTIILIAACVFAVNGVACVISAIVKLAVATKKWKSLIAMTIAQLETEQRNASTAQDEIKKHWDETVQAYLNEVTTERFPLAYAKNYAAVSEMLDLMNNLRADTIKEAINLYEENCYRAQMGAAFGNIASTMALSAEVATTVAKSVSVIADNSKKNKH